MIASALDNTMSGFQKLITRNRTKGKTKNKPIEPVKAEPLAAPDNAPYSGLFSTIHTYRPAAPDEDSKITVLEHHICSLGILNLGKSHMRFALRSAYSGGDLEKTLELLILMSDSMDGILYDYTLRMSLVGAENKDGVSCYLDSVLFAMFARLDCFEAILYNVFNDEPRRNLAVMLRIWVNMLRSGKLITKDITGLLLDTIAKCGWPAANKREQQDASEAFTFITEKLELPLLTLQVDLYHTGKEEANDDHKFVNERLLEIAIPPDRTDGLPITLEDCLELYFNNRVEVRRYLERRQTKSPTSKGDTTHVEVIDMGLSPTSTIVQSPVPGPITEEDQILVSSSHKLTESPLASPSLESEHLPRTISPMATHCSESEHSLRNTSSIVQKRLVPESQDDVETGMGESTFLSNRTRGMSVRNEVLMPALQAFSLLPWYTDNVSTNGAQNAVHFSSKRPILGMCLKRYSISSDGQAIRRDTYVDIPIEIGLPHFIQDDEMDDDGPLFGNFKLVLQAVVCHRGNSVNSGHYISFVRATTHGSRQRQSSPVREGDDDADLDKTMWMRFDDLARDRITVADIHLALQKESPYLLFYQVLPIDSPSDIDSEDDILPPAYEDHGFSEKAGGIFQRPMTHTASNSDSARTMSSVSEKANPDYAANSNTEQGNGTLLELPGAKINKEGGKPRSFRESIFGSGRPRSRPTGKDEDSRSNNSIFRLTRQSFESSNRDATKESSKEPLKDLAMETTKESRAGKKRGNEKDSPNDNSQIPTQVSRDQAKGGSKRFRGKGGKRSKLYGGEPDRECAIM